jgi:hypothetical protein
MQRKLLWDPQCGFRRKRSSTDYTYYIRQILEKKWEYSKPVRQLFVGFKTTSD